MTIVVYRGRKTTTQQQQQSRLDKLLIQTAGIRRYGRMDRHTYGQIKCCMPRVGKGNKGSEV